MKKHHASSQGKYFPLAILFLVGFISIFIFSFIWKTISILRQSIFNGQEQFIILVAEPQKTAQVFVLNPNTQTIHMITVPQETTTHVSKDLSIPYNVMITSNMTIQEVGDIAPFFKHLIFSGETGPLTSIDKLRLWWFAKSLKGDAMTINTISLPLQQNSSDTLLPTLFMDQTIYQEGKTIAIVNASGIEGVGSRAAKVLTNIGCNVISVTTNETLQQKTSITYTTATTVGYTLKRVQKIFHTTPTLSMQSSVADITITLGEDEGGEF